MSLNIRYKQRLLPSVYALACDEPNCIFGENSVCISHMDTEIRIIDINHSF